MPSARHALFSRRLVTHPLRQGLHCFFLCLFLLANVLGSGFFPATALAAGQPHAPAPAATNTFQQFLQHARATQQQRPRFVRPPHVPNVPLAKGEQPTPPAHLPSSAEPPTMQPLTVTLNTAF